MVLLVRLSPLLRVQDTQLHRAAVVVGALYVRRHRLGHGQHGGEAPDGPRDQEGPHGRRPAVSSHRVDDGDVAVAAEGRQGEHGDAQGQRLEELVELTERLSVGPLGKGVDGGRERYRDQDEHQVAQRQTHDEDVGHVAHVLVAHHREDERAVADDADDEDEEEDDGHGVGFRSVAQHTSAAGRGRQRHVAADISGAATAAAADRHRRHRTHCRLHIFSSSDKNYSGMTLNYSLYLDLIQLITPLSHLVRLSKIRTQACMYSGFRR